MKTADIFFSAGTLFAALVFSGCGTTAEEAPTSFAASTVPSRGNAASPSAAGAGTSAEVAAASVPAAAPKSENFVIVETPLDGFRRDTEECFRAVGQGESTNPAIAEKIAGMNALTALSQHVGGQTISVAQEMLNESRISAGGEEAVSKFREFARGNVQMTMPVHSVIDTMTVFDAARGRYVAYVAVEVRRAAVAEQLADTLSSGRSAEERAEILTRISRLLCVPAN